jgi:hypothetical protein
MIVVSSEPASRDIGSARDRVGRRYTLADGGTFTCWASGSPVTVIPNQPTNGAPSMSETRTGELESHVRHEMLSAVVPPTPSSTPALSRRRAVLATLADLSAQLMDPSLLVTSAEVAEAQEPARRRYVAADLRHLHHLRPDVIERELSQDHANRYDYRVSYDWAQEWIEG